MRVTRWKTSMVIIAVIALSGCTKSPEDVSYHGRSVSNGSYHGMWKSRANDGSSQELAHLLIFDQGTKPFQGSSFVGPKVHTTTQRGVPLNPTGFTLAPEGIFLNGKRIEGRDGERVFVVLMFEDSKVIPVRLSDSELECLTRDKIERIESSTVWEKILNAAHAE